MEYIVQSGDTLFLIARRFGITLAQLLAANPQITNPNLIFPGQRINIPLPPGTTVYIVQRGDTLFLIARRFGTTVNEILRLNPGIANPNLIFPGQRIVVPVAAPVTPPGCVAYVSDRTGRPELWRSDALGREQIQLTRQSGTPEKPVSNPQWSPGGKFIAYQAVGGLFVIDHCGRNPIFLAQNVAPLAYSWSNRGTMIAYSTMEETPPAEGAFIVNLTGQSSFVAANFKRPVWFPGDMRLAGFTEREAAFPVLATVNITGENFTEFDVPAALVKLSPNGRYAATQLLQASAFRISSSVFVYDFQTGSRVQLPGMEVQVTPDRSFNFSVLGGWSPDSAHIVYSTLTNINGLGEIRIATPEGAVVSAFTRGFYPESDWGPVQEWINYTVSDRPGTELFPPTVPRNIYVRNINTGNEIKITSVGDNYNPDWAGTPCRPCF